MRVGKKALRWVRAKGCNEDKLKEGRKKGKRRRKEKTRMRQRRRYVPTQFISKWF